jgi:hypothetical protein
VLMNERRQAVATARNSRAITRLATTQAAAVKRLTAQQVKSDKNISQRISQTYSGLDKRITRELAGTGGLGRHGKVMMRQLKLQRQRATWNNILIASSLPFFAAYGTTAKPFAKNNVILTANVLGWLLLDDFVDSFRSKSTTLRGGANIWSYLAPVGNGATAFFLLDKKQHERFLTGFNPVTAATGATVDLTTKIASRSVDDFKKGDRNVVATVVGAAAATTAVVAQVKNGILSLDVSADATVAWVVDTQPQT